MIVLLVATFLYVVLTGPDGRDYMKRRKTLLDQPKASVIYLPSWACRGSKPKE